MSRGAKDFENGQINNTARKKLGNWRCSLCRAHAQRARTVRSERARCGIYRPGNVTAAINATVHVPIRERQLDTLTLTEGGTSSPDAVCTAGGTFSVPGLGLYTLV